MFSWLAVALASELQKQSLPFLIAVGELPSRKALWFVLNLLVCDCVIQWNVSTPGGGDLAPSRCSAMIPEWMKARACASAGCLAVALERERAVSGSWSRRNGCGWCGEQGQSWQEWRLDPWSSVFWSLQSYLLVACWRGRQWLVFEAGEEAPVEM